LRKNLRLVQTLVEAGASLIAVDKHEFSFLEYAILSKEQDIISFLLSTGKCTQRAKDRALQLAVKERNYSIVPLLCSQGANPEYIDSLYPVEVLKVAKLCHREVWEFLKTNYPEAANYRKEVHRRKLIGHICQIYGTRQVLFADSKKRHLSRSFCLEGFSYRFICKKVLKGIQQFRKQFPHIIEEHVKNEIVQLIELALLHNENKQRMFENYEAGEPVLCQVGYPGHAAYILIKNEYFILCNQQIDRTIPQVFKIKFKFDKKTFISILSSLSQHNKNSFFESKLKLVEHPNFTTTYHSRALEWALSQVSQNGGTCTWTNMLKAILAITLFHAHLEAPLKPCLNWLFFQGLFTISKDIKRKIEEIKQEKLIYQPDIELYEEALCRIKFIEQTRIIDSKIIDMRKDVEFSLLDLNNLMEELNDRMAKNPE